MTAKVALVVAALLAVTIGAPVAARQEATPAAAGAAVTAEGCWTPEQRLPTPGEDGARYSAAPALVIDPARGYVATLATSEGTFEIELFPVEAPLAVNNFVCLAADGFYTGTPFHRILAGFVIQGGDPTGTGSGGPGYAFPDEPPLRAYERGIVAMANAGPNTNGSQFFVILDDLRQQLPPNYTVFGQVIDGQDVVDAIAAVETTTSPSGEPSQPVETVTLEQVTVREAPPVAAATPVPAAEGSLGALADRIGAAWNGVTTYRTTVTFAELPPPGADPAATPAPLADAGVIADEVLLPDRRRQTTNLGSGESFEAVAVAGRLYTRGLPSGAGPEATPADPSVWAEVDPATLNPGSQLGRVLLGLLQPIEPPFADLPPDVRGFPAVPLGPISIGGTPCDGYLVTVPDGPGGPGAELTIALGPDDLPCWTETRSGGIASLIIFSDYNTPLTIEAPPIGTAATPAA